jgi:hypothetical protein
MNMKYFDWGKTLNPCPSFILSIEVFNPFQSFYIAYFSQSRSHEDQTDR